MKKIRKRKSVGKVYRGKKDTETTALADKIPKLKHTCGLNNHTYALHYT